MQILWTCDECGEPDPSTLKCAIRDRDTHHVDTLDLCAFCRDELSDVQIIGHADRGVILDIAV